MSEFSAPSESTQIDLLAVLDAGAIGKPSPAGNGANGAGPFDEAALIEAVRSGASYHRAALSLLAHWAHQGSGMLEAEARLRGLFEDVFPPDRDHRWHDRVAEIRRLLSYVYGKLADKDDE